MSAAMLIPMLMAGTAVSAGASILGGLAAKRQGDFEAKIARQNATIALQRSEAESVRVARDRDRRQGLLRATIGASGVQLTGSPLDLLAEEAMEGEEARLAVLFGGEGQARNERIRATAAKARGRAALIGGIGKGVGTSLSLLGESKK